MSPTLEVLTTGPLLLIEDDGRPGLAAVGVGRSGAADRASYRLGARLVGHAPGRAALEVLLGGLTVRAHGRVTVALTGAPAPATVDGRPVAHAGLVDVPDGATIALGMPATGLRTYLTVRGGIDVPPVLGSRSTDTCPGSGHHRCGWATCCRWERPGRDFPTVDHAAHPPPGSDDPAVLEVRPGPRAAWVGGWPTGLGGLLGVQRVVSADSDRAGVRLAGSPVQRAARWRDVELPSEGMVRGAVQVPPGGEPVLFLADHPVTGGYPVVGVLTASAGDRAAQLRPGDAVRLVRAAALS